MLFKNLSFNLFIKNAITLLTSVFILFGCEPALKQPKPPIDVPIALDKGGEVVEFEVYINEDYFYTLGLKYFFDKTKPGDADDLLKLIENNGIWGQVLVEVDVIIWSVTGSKLSIVYKNTVPVIKTLSGGNGDYLKEIAELKLRPGIYKIRVENKMAREQFSNREIAVTLEPSYRGK